LIYWLLRTVIFSAQDRLYAAKYGLKLPVGKNIKGQEISKKPTCSTTERIL